MSIRNYNTAEGREIVPSAENMDKLNKNDKQPLERGLEGEKSAKHSNKPELNEKPSSNNALGISSNALNNLTSKGLQEENSFDNNNPNGNSKEKNNIDSSKYKGDDLEKNKPFGKDSEVKKQLKNAKNKKNEQKEKKNRAGKYAEDGVRPLKLAADVTRDSAKKGIDTAKKAGDGIGKISKLMKSEDPNAQAKQIVGSIVGLLLGFLLLILPVIMPSLGAMSILYGTKLKIQSKNEAFVDGDTESYLAESAKNYSDDVFKEHKTIIDDALANTVYEDAKEQAKQLCEDKGYDWDDVEKKLSSTESDSWSSIWGNSNYVDMIVGLNIGYAEVNNVTAADDIDIETIISDEDVYQHLYYLTYKEEEVPTDDGKTKKELYIKINPFALEDLAAICDMEITDVFEDTYSLSFKTRLSQTSRYYKVTSSDEIVELLNMGVTTPDYHATDFTIYERQETYSEIDLGDFDTSGWYSPASDVVSDSAPSASPSKTFDGWLRLYAQPTVTITSSSFFTNIPNVMSDIYSDVSNNVSNISSASPPSAWCNYEFGIWDKKETENGTVKGAIHYCRKSIYKEQGGKLGVDNEGRYLIAVGPGVVKCNYWSETGGVGNPSRYYDYANKKIDLVLKEKSTGNIYYLPCSLGDAKGHTFPYGIVQTGIATPSAASAQVDGATFKKDKSIKNRDHYYKNLGSVKDDGYVSIMDTFSTKLYNEEKYTMSQWMKGGAIEFFYTSDSSAITRLNTSFDIIGTITY